MRGLSLAFTVALAALFGAGNASSLYRLRAGSCAVASGPFPNPDDCSSYLQCESSGVIAVRPCPGGLEFNPKLRVCDYPDRAGCSSVPSSDDDNQDDDNGNNGDNGGNGGNGGDSPAPPDDAPSCLAVENPKDVVQLPNPNNCNSFWKCDENGVAWLIPCPPGLEYNAELRVCDYPENAGCSSGSAGGNDQPSEDAPANGGEGGDNNAGDNGDNNPKPPADAPSCPAVENPEDVVQLPNPSDCSSFYKCDENGVAWLVPCPDGLEYNAELRVCDYPENAGCSSASANGDQQPPAEKPSEDTPGSGGEGEGSSDNKPESPADVPECPAVWDPEDVVQFPNPSDCSSFYKCDENGVAWLIPCPDGLEYNAELRVCDYPQNAGCSA